MCIGVWFIPRHIAYAILALPLITIVIAQYSISSAERKANSQRQNEWNARKVAVEEQLADIPRDFVCISDELPLAGHCPFLLPIKFKASLPVLMSIAGVLVLTHAPGAFARRSAHILALPKAQNPVLDFPQ